MYEFSAEVIAPICLIWFVAMTATLVVYWSVSATDCKAIHKLGGPEMEFSPFTGCTEVEADGGIIHDSPHT